MYIINDLLAIYFDEYHELSDNKRKKWSPVMILINYFLKHLIIMCDLKMKSVDLSEMPLKCHEEVKERAGLKFLFQANY